MKTIITAIAPTSYQLNSLNAFGMPYKKNGNGSFSAQKSFEDREEAINYLNDRAILYNDQDPEGNNERLADMLADIEHGSLRLDGVSAYIQEIEE